MFIEPKTKSNVSYIGQIILDFGGHCTLPFLYEIFLPSPCYVLHFWKSLSEFSTEDIDLCSLKFRCLELLLECGEILLSHCYTVKLFLHETGRSTEFFWLLQESLFKVIWISYLKYNLMCFDLSQRLTSKSLLALLFQQKINNFSRIFCSIILLITGWV